METISPGQFIECLTRKGAGTVAIDVRSPGEVQQGSLPGTVNVPLLNNDHRHQVGLTYKKHGPDAAIAKGHELVDPIRSTLEEGWKQAAGDNQVHVFCWRGGLRSHISLEWMQACGLRGLQVEGGYKAVRQELLRAAEFPPSLLVVAGETGAGKTEFIRGFSHHLDLEALAAHRGSVFGGTDRPQPNQSTFENAVGLALRGRAGPLLVEDESRQIGYCRLPQWLYQAKQNAPMIRLEAPMAERVNRIYRDYVGASPSSEREQALLNSLRRLAKPLGGERLQQLETMMGQAFRTGSKDAHGAWIERLLVEYYDPRYRWAMEKRAGFQRFRGDFEACRQWLLRKGFS